VIEVFKKLVFVILACFIFFIMIEILLRVYVWRKTGNSEYLRYAIEITKMPKKDYMAKEHKITSRKVNYGSYYKFTPGKYEMLSLPFSYTINSLGFRGYEFSTTKSKDIKRIFALGCSTTFGLGVVDNQTYPYYLNELLKNSGRKYEVINCGLPTALTYHIYELFSNEIINYEPDIIIISESINDALFVTPQIKNFWYKLHSSLYYRSMLYTLLLEKYSALKRNDSRPFFIFYNKSIPHYYKYYLERIIKLAKEKGIKVILFNEPMLSDVNFPNDLDKLEIMYRDTFDSSISPLIKQRYYNKQMEIIAKENNIDFIDAAKLIEEKPHLFLDIVHLSAEGNELLAKLIAKVIMEGK